MMVQVYTCISLRVCQNLSLTKTVFAELTAKSVAEPAGGGTPTVVVAAPTVITLIIGVIVVGVVCFVLGRRRHLRRRKR